MLKKISIFLSVVVMTAVLLAIQAAAADTPPPDAADITITNNLAGTPDTVEINNVQVNDIIRVYSTASGGAPVGVMVAGGPSVTFSINQLGTGAGNAHVSVTTTGFSESPRTLKAYLAEPKTPSPVFDDSGDITIQNNVGRPDYITVSNLADKDIVRVYQNSVSTVALGTVVSTGTSAFLYVNQLGVAAGTVYITVQGEDALESARTAKGYDSETSALLAEDAVAVVNNFYTAPGGIQPAASYDTITVEGVAVDDTITVYKALIGTEVWVAPVTLETDDIIGGEVKFNISQLGTKAGKLYVTIMTPMKAESKRAAFSYSAEPVSDPPMAGNVKVTNNYNADDIVDVTGLAPGDIFTVYNSPVSPVTIGSDTVGIGETAASALIDAEDLLATGGKIYVTVTSTGKNESDRVTVTYKKEDTNTALSASKVEVTNNYNIVDTVKVTGLAVDDIIKVYSTATGATFIDGATATGTEVTIPLGTTTLLTKGGNIYVTLTTLSKSESPRTPVSYKAEKVTAAPAVGTVTVVNNYTASDTVTVTGLQEYDEVRVYLSPTGGTNVGFDAVGVGETSATADVANPLLSPTGGKIYVSVKSQTANESTRTLVTYTIEATTTAPALTNIAVANNYNTDDSIVISGVAEDDVVKVYAAPTGTTLISSGTVAAGQTSITFTPSATALSANGGKIYVSVKIPLANESPRTAFAYTSERSAAPLANTVTVTNNYYVETDPTSRDTVRVTGVATGDIINIYKASGGTTKWAGPVTAAAPGALDITIDQLGTKAANIYVTVTKLNKSESARTSVSHLSEPVTTALTAASIIIDNRFGSDDVVTVNNLTANQIVTLYASTTGAAILTPVTAAGSSYTFVLDNNVLAAGGGKLYVSVKNPLELESIRTAQTYTSETTVSPKIGNILVVNYPGTAYDTVTLVGLTAGDIVKIYNAATGGTVLVTATVSGKGTTLTLDTNLPDTGGIIYVTVTNDGKAESKRTSVAYQDA